MQELLYLATFYEATFGALVDKPWVADGFDESEATVVQNLRWAARQDEAASLRIVGMPFLETVEPADAAAMEVLADLTAYESGILSAVVTMPWVEGGLDESEREVVRNLGWIADKDEAVALLIVGMPFLKTVEPADAAAMRSLQRLVWIKRQDFERVMSHPTLSGGITDRWAKIVAVLYGVSQYNPRLIGTLLDPDQVTMEERAIDLPLAGMVDLAIVRTGPRATRSMDLLEHAVRYAEAFMGAPFPTGYVGWLFGDAVTPSFAGNNFGTHIATLPKYDIDDGSHDAESTGVIIAHEVAHYYWSGNTDWVDEGAANLMASVSENARTGQAVGVTNEPCGYARTIADLERLAPSQEDGADSAFTCNYALGERLFLDLYRGLSEARFQGGLQNLYLASEVEDDEDTQGGTAVGIDHLKTAFKVGADIAAPIVDVMAARWYDGSEPYDTSARDTEPVDPALRAVNGRIDQAYVSTIRGGTPGSSFSAKTAKEGVWLFLDIFLEYGDTLAPSREVELELVDYFEDGFLFDRRSVSFTAEVTHSAGWRWWLPVGVATSGPRATGRYWAYVYHEGRKVAEVEYEVTA